MTCLICNVVLIALSVAFVSIVGIIASAFFALVCSGVWKWWKR
jgi:hypothetical protein